MDGFQEETTEFKGAASAFAGLARFRTFGAEGPTYEVLNIGPGTVRVHIFDNDEEFDYRTDRALNDPLAR